MPLVRNRPTHAVSANLFDPFEHLFDLVAPPSRTSREPEFPMDLYETDEAWHLELAVPGLSASDVDVSVEGRDLTIQATFETPQEEGRRYWSRTIARGAITRTFKLPTTVDVESVEARVRDGLLSVAMPKVGEAKVKKIAVQAN